MVNKLSLSRFLAEKLKAQKKLSNKLGDSVVQDKEHIIENTYSIYKSTKEEVK